MKGKKQTPEQIIQRCKDTHNNFYSYDNAVPNGMVEKIWITCPIEGHGDFYQSPNHHIHDKTGCPTCGCKQTPERIINRCKEAHNNFYSYDNAKPNGIMNKIWITCPIEGHGDFYQTPNNHINNKDGCPTCSGTKKSNTEEFIQKILLIPEHKDKEYDFGLVDYKGNKIKIKIICLKEGHGEFEITPNSFLNGHGCHKCSIESHIKNHTLTQEEALQKCHDLNRMDEFDYGKFNYINGRTKVIIICLKCKYEFKQNPFNHWQGQGCPHCNITNGEKGVRKFSKKTLLL
jgi:hypothetical protein